MAWLAPVRLTVPPLGVKVPVECDQLPATLKAPALVGAERVPPVRLTLKTLRLPVPPLKEPALTRSEPRASVLAPTLKVAPLTLRFVLLLMRLLPARLNVPASSSMAPAPAFKPLASSAMVPVAL